MKGHLRAEVICLAVFAAAAPVCAAGFEFPDYAGVLNVRDASFGAKGDGLSDDTIAIQTALLRGNKERRIVYIPDGIYLVSDTLRWDGEGCVLQGQSRSGTIVRLAKSAPGFGDESKPKPVLTTGDDGNPLCDLSVETGENNEGAIGIELASKTRGAMRRVSVSGTGWCGLRVTGGSRFSEDVSVAGFRFGIRAEGRLCEAAFADISLAGQSEVGLQVDDAVVAFRGLKSSGAPVGIRVSGAALVDLLGVEMQGANSEKQAIEVIGNEPRLFMRDVKSSGYDGVMISRGMLYSIPNIQEWCSEDSFGNWGKKASALALPVEEAPSLQPPAGQDWADAGEPDGRDDTARVQAALNGGKAAVLLRHGVYRIADTLRVPASVKMILGAGASIETADSFPGDHAVFMFKDGSPDDFTQIERIAVRSRGNFLANHADTRTLVLRDLRLQDTSAYRNREESGKLFVENVAAPIHILHPTSVWIRGYSIDGMAGIDNNGGTIWALGCSLRSSGTLIENRNGGSLEAWGVVISANKKTSEAAIINDRSGLSLSLAGAPPFYEVLVHDDQGGSTKEYRSDALPSRGEGAPIVPLFISSPEPTGKRAIE